MTTAELNKFQCEFLTRKKTFCKSMKTVGKNYCSKHWQTDTVDTKINNTVADMQDDKAQSNNTLEGHKKTNLKRPLKRMLNPFIIRSQDINLTFKKQIHLDIGSAKGKYLKTMAIDSDYDYVGVEIFNALVVQANREYASDNLVYVNCNINRDLEKFPMLTRVSLLFPDPWSCGPDSTDKNVKRRVMNADFATRIAKRMHPGGEFYLATDWLELALEIKNYLLDTGIFFVPGGKEGGRVGHIAKPPYVPTIPSFALETNKDIPISTIDLENNYPKPSVSDLELDSAQDLWLDGIPFNGIQTERDQVCEMQWRSVYRLVLTRNDQIYR
jgi:tRNA G46 methylase TrmB